MAGITLAQAQAQLTLWLDASTAVSKGREYTIGDRILKLTDSEDILSQIRFWEAKVCGLNQQQPGKSNIARANFFGVN